MRDLLPAFFDELEKVAVTLTPEERRREALQFAGLGTLTVPAMGAVTSKIQSGKWIPSAAKSTPRWLAGAMGAGLFWGGLLPSIRHALSRTTMEGARKRFEAERELKRLVPESSTQKGVTVPAKTVPMPRLT